jgi:DeoR family glycerol-3-phosphate regulon repressor
MQPKHKKTHSIIVWFCLLYKRIIMHRLPATARRKQLISLLEKRGYISATEVAAELNVSDMTIRRDLAYLAAQGLLLRDHGGATLSEKKHPAEEPSFFTRQRLQHDSKERIAKAAMQLIHPGETIGLDTGTTTYTLAELLLPIQGLQIFTSSLRIASCLAAGPSATHMLAGRMRPDELSVCGPSTSAQLRSLWLDKLFTGIAGLHETGLYEYTLEESEVKQTFITQSQQVILLCDSSKFDQRCLAHVALLDSIHILITDAEPPSHLLQALLSAGVEIMIV